MKKDFIHGFFLIAAAIIGPIITWVLTSKSYKVEIEHIMENFVSKESIYNTYIEKSEYDKLKNSINLTEANLSNTIESYKHRIDSLTRELKFVRVKCEKIATIPPSVVKLEVDNTLLEIEKVYRKGKYIVVDVRITNIGNDKERYGLDQYRTVVKTDDGMEYKIQKTLKGGKKTYSATSELFNKEDVLYSLYCGDVSSQLTYDVITFRSVTSDETPILKRIAWSVIIDSKNLKFNQVSLIL